MSYIEKHAINTEEDAVQFLKGHVRIKANIESVVEFSPDHSTPVSTIRDTLAAIKEIEEHFTQSESWELKYWLGKGLSWCGELYSSIEHLEAAYCLSEGKLDDNIPSGQKQKNELFDRNDIASEIGESYLKIGHVSFVEKAIEYLAKVLNHCEGYHPAIMRLAEANFQVGNFLDAANIAENAKNRLKHDSYWSNKVNNTKNFSNLLSKCYSKEALKQRDIGEISKAVQALEAAKEKGVIKSIDEELLKRLRQQELVLSKEKSNLEQIILSKPIILTIRRELKNKYPDCTFDFEAIKLEIQKRMQLPEVEGS